MVSLDMGADTLLLGEDEPKIYDSFPVVPQEEPLSKLHQNMIEELSHEMLENTKVDDPVLSTCSQKAADLPEEQSYADCLSEACTPIASQTVGKKPQDFAQTFVPISSHTLQEDACVAEVVVVKSVRRLQFSETPTVKSRVELALENAARLHAAVALWKMPLKQMS